MGNKQDFFSPHIKDQAMLAVKEADLILFLVDTLEGLTAEDRMLASVLRKRGGDLSKSVVVLANKVRPHECDVAQHSTAQSSETRTQTAQRPSSQYH